MEVEFPKQCYIWVEDETLAEALDSHDVPFSSVEDAIIAANQDPSLDNLNFKVISTLGFILYDSSTKITKDIDITDFDSYLAYHGRSRKKIGF